MFILKVVGVVLAAAVVLAVVVALAALVAVAAAVASGIQLDPVLCVVLDPDGQVLELDRWDD